MIRPLRQRHRQVFAILAVTLPTVFAIGVGARRPVPAVESLPAALMPKVDVFNAAIWSRDDLFSKIPMHTTLLRERADVGRFAVQLMAPASFAKPDLLVYWSADSAEVKNKIPENSVLISSFSGSAPLPLPSEFPSMQGRLVLYSLADGEVVEVSKTISLR